MKVSSPQHGGQLRVSVGCRFGDGTVRVERRHGVGSASRHLDTYRPHSRVHRPGPSLWTSVYRPPPWAPPLPGTVAGCARCSPPRRRTSTSTPRSGPSRAGGTDGPWVVANMISSVDGAATVEGRSGALGRAGRPGACSWRCAGVADVVLVGAGTVRAERYGPPEARRCDDRPAHERRPRPHSPDRHGLGLARHRPGAARCSATPPAARWCITARRPRPATAGRRSSDVADVWEVGTETVDVAEGRWWSSAQPAPASCSARAAPRCSVSSTSPTCVDEWCVTVGPVAGRRGGSPDRHDRHPRGREQLQLDRLWEDDGAALPRGYLRRSMTAHRQVGGISTSWPGTSWSVPLNSASRSTTSRMSPPRCRLWAMPHRVSPGRTTPSGGDRAGRAGCGRSTSDPADHGRPPPPRAARGRAAATSEPADEEHRRRRTRRRWTVRLRSRRGGGGRGRSVTTRWCAGSFGWSERDHCCHVHILLIGSDTLGLTLRPAARCGR